MSLNVSLHGGWMCEYSGLLLCTSDFIVAVHMPETYIANKHRMLFSPLYLIWANYRKEKFFVTCVQMTEVKPIEV